MNPSGSTAAAFADLQWLRSFAAVLATDADVADDLVQETLVAAWTKPAADTPPAAPDRGWPHGPASVEDEEHAARREARHRRAPSARGGDV